MCYFCTQKLKRRVINLDYVIKNPKNVFIQLNENGRPVTCTEENKGIFEYSKAKNICDNLPKTLKQLKFCVEAIPDIPQKLEEGQKIIVTNTYTPSEKVMEWLNKFGQCEDIINEAKERDMELNKELSEADLKLSDIIHEIELSDKCDMYTAWKIVNKIRSLRRFRREIKNERYVISGIKTQGITYLARSSVQKCIDGLSKRKYTYRVVEEDEEDAIV